MPTVETVTVENDGKLLTTPQGEEYPLVASRSLIPFARQHAAISTAFDVDPKNYSLNFDIYNPSSPVINPPGKYWYVRVDGPCNRTKSIAFQEVGSDFMVYPNATFDNHEDPSAINITCDNYIKKSQILYRAVEVKKYLDNDAEVSGFRQVLYMGPTMDRLERVFEGLEGMKDLCPVRKNHAIKTKRGQGFYTRPRFPGIPALGGDGQIGYTEIDSFSDLARMSPTKFDIFHASLISYRFPDGQWGGVNDAVEITEEGPYFGSNLLLTHKAWKDFPQGKQNRHYVVTWLIHDIKKNTVINFDYNISRADVYPYGTCKNQNISQDLWDVNYGMSICEIGHDFITISTGIGDTMPLLFDTPNPLRFLDSKGNKVRQIFSVPYLPATLYIPEKLAA